MFSVTADFNMADVEAYINDEMEVWFDEMVETYKVSARKFVDSIRARTQVEGSFGNITWNLRSSIGYLLLYNGKIVDSYFPVVGGGVEGSSTGLDYAKEIALLVDEDGVQLVIVAGMEYAVFVEENDIDVLSHASKRFPKLLIQEFNRAA